MYLKAGFLRTFTQLGFFITLPHANNETQLDPTPDRLKEKGFYLRQDLTREQKTNMADNNTRSTRNPR
jgi:hypothetical protein